MRYLDICSGISAPTMAWKPLGWEALCFAEIEAAPRSVLTHHYPDVPLRGDFTEIEGTEYGPVDLLVGGTPCQSFSVAGLRGGIHDDRGNLALEFLRLAGRARPRWLVWENVPGVFSALSHDAPDFRPPDIDLDSGDGPEDGEEIVVEDRYDADESHAFACFLAGLSELGYGFAYRVFDAQFAGVPQRRRRVFVVGHLGDWRRAAAVLFERHSLSGNPAPRRQAGPSVAALTANGVGTCGADDNQGQAGHLIPQGHGGEVAPTLNAAFGSKLGLDNQHIDSGAGLFVAHSLRAEGFDASEDGTGRGTPLVPVVFQSKASASNSMNPGPVSPAIDVGKSDGLAICFTAKDHGADAGDIAPTLRAGGHSGSHANAGVMPAVAFALGSHAGAADADVSNRSHDAGGPVGSHISEECAYSLRGGRTQNVAHASAVRRLTPRECERLQGFPDDFTLVPHRGKPMADGPRYKMLGNSMAVPVVRWIGERIELVEAIGKTRDLAA